MKRPAPMLAGAVVAAAALFTAAGALAAGASHTTNWTTPDRSVECGIADVYGTQFDAGTGASLNGMFPGLQCGAEGIPRSPSSSVGDPFVQLGQGSAGRAKVVDESQDDLLFNGAPKALGAGSAWSRNGITCKVSARSIRCQNSSGHGFTLSTGHVKLFS